MRVIVLIELSCLSSLPLLPQSRQFFFRSRGEKRFATVETILRFSQGGFHFVGFFLECDSRESPMITRRHATQVGHGAKPSRSEIEVLTCAIARVRVISNLTISSAGPINTAGRDATRRPVRQPEIRAPARAVPSFSPAAAAGNLVSVAKLRVGVGWGGGEGERGRGQGKGRQNRTIGECSCGCPFVPDVNPISTADVKCRTDFGFVCVNSGGRARGWRRGKLCGNKKHRAPQRARARVPRECVR